MWFYRPALWRILKIDLAAPGRLAQKAIYSTSHNPPPTDEMAGNISEEEEEVAKVMEALLVAVVNGDAATALDRDLESNADPPKQARVEGAVSACDRQMFAEYKHTLGGSAPLDTYLERLRLFFHHTLNAHVNGLTGSGVDEAGFALHASRGAAQAACKVAAGIGDEEFKRLFYSVDRVHAYT